jgi:tetratricopeptide (TPR) repeat protein
LRALLREIGKADELLRRGIALLEEEVQSTTGDSELQRYLAYAWWVLGNLMKDTSRLADAQTAYENSLNASSEELRYRPDSRFLLRSRANVLTNLCAVMVGQNRHREALPRFEQALSLLRSLLAESPEDFGSQSELALAFHDYSTTLRVLQQPEAATRAFDEAFAIREQLLQRDPEDHGNRVLFARLYMSRGWMARSANQPAAALSEFRQAGAMLQPSVDAFPSFFEYQLALLLAQEAQLEASLATGDAATTESVWSGYTARLLRCRDLFPLERRIVHKMETWLPHRCEHLFEQHRSDECRALFASLLSAAEWLTSDEAAALSPEASSVDRAGWFNNLAWYLTIAPDPSQRDLPRAVAMARTSLELVPDVTNHLHTLATALYENGQFADALETIELAIRNLPADLPARQRDPLINVILASAHWQLGQVAEARQALSQVPDPPAGLTRNAAELRRHIGAIRTLIPPDTPAE